MPIIPQPHGGAIFQAEKGQTKNPFGRPKTPKTIKDFIKKLEYADDEVLLPIEKIEIVEKDGKKFYKLKNSKGAKLFLAIYNQAFEGNTKALDILIRLGFAGGYEPIKTENQTSITEYIVESNL